MKIKLLTESNDIVWWHGFNEVSDYVYYFVETLKKNQSALSSFKRIVDSIVGKLGETDFTDPTYNYERLAKALSDIYVPMLLKITKSDKFFNDYYDVLCDNIKYFRKDTGGYEGFLEMIKDQVTHFNKKDMREDLASIMFRAIISDYRDGAHEIEDYVSGKNKEYLDKQSIERGKEKLGIILRASKIKFKESKNVDLKNDLLKESIKKIIKDIIKESEGKVDNNEILEIALHLWMIENKIPVKIVKHSPDKLYTKEYLSAAKSKVKYINDKIKNKGLSTEDINDLVNGKAGGFTRTIGIILK